MTIEVYYRYAPHVYEDILYNSYHQTPINDLIEEWLATFTKCQVRVNLLTPRCYRLNEYQHPKKYVRRLSIHDLLDLITTILNNKNIDDYDEIQRLCPKEDFLAKVRPLVKLYTEFPADTLLEILQIER